MLPTIWAFENYCLPLWDSLHDVMGTVMKYDKHIRIDIVTLAAPAEDTTYPSVDHVLDHLSCLSWRHALGRHRVRRQILDAVGA